MRVYYREGIGIVGIYAETDRGQVLDYGNTQAATSKHFAFSGGDELFKGFETVTTPDGFIAALSVISLLQDPSKCIPPPPISHV